MASHRITIPEAVRLTERSRRSLYRDMANGRLAYHVGHDERRLVDISELIRAYGPLTGMTELESSDAQGEGMPAPLLAQILDVMREQSKTLTAQCAELAALREEVRELRTLPAPGQLANHPDDTLKQEQPASKPDPATTPAEDREPARGFSDILARLEARTPPR